jgi:hypothetical protein
LALCSSFLENDLIYMHGVLPKMSTAPEIVQDNAKENIILLILHLDLKLWKNVNLT